MATRKKAVSSSTAAPTVRVEYDCGIKGERRTKEFEDATKAKKFIAAKKRAGKNPKVLKTEHKRKAKRKFKVTAVTEVDFGPGTPPATETKTRKPTEGSAPQKPAVPGVRPMRTRPYLAGTIIAKHGLAAGVTDAMVAELDEAYGKPNATESQFCLKNAFHAARGYLGIAEDAVE